MKKFTLGFLTFLGLGFGTIFAQNILPDSADIDVKSSIIMGEATNLGITIKKNDSKMAYYTGTILMFIVDEAGNPLQENDFTLPNNGRYTFLQGDLGHKEFQRGLEIKKEGRFYVTVEDLNSSEEKELGRQLIVVTKDIRKPKLQEIKVVSPVHNSNIIGDKIEILANCESLPNSEAIIYIDDNQIGTGEFNSDGWISKSLSNLTEGQHELKIEIPDKDGIIVGQSSKVFFTTTPGGNGGIKNVTVEPEKGLMIQDMTKVTVYTDDMIELVKMRLSDRPINDAFVMSKDKIGEFSQNVFLVATGEINLSFDTEEDNGSVTKSYENYKTITVMDIPSIFNENVKTDIDEKSAHVSWEVTNSGVVSSYLIDRWDENGVLSGKDRSTGLNFHFNDVPYDTIIKLNITPYWNKATRHGVPSKTIQFVISKIDLCGNGICDEGETYETCPEDCLCGNGICDEGETPESCPQDCGPICGNGICEPGETPESCPQDCGPICGNGICEPGETPESCPEDCGGGKPKSTCDIQNVPVRTTKIGESYYLVRDKAKDVTKYIVYSSPTPDPRNRTKVYETKDTSYEYPFDYNAKKETYMYFRVIGICEGEEYDLTGATKVKVGPTENFFLLLCLTLLIYSGIKLFRKTEE